MTGDHFAVAELIERLTAEGRIRGTDLDDDEVGERRRVVDYAKRQGLEPAGKRIEWTSPSTASRIPPASDRSRRSPQIRSVPSVDPERSVRLVVELSRGLTGRPGRWRDRKTRTLGALGLIRGEIEARAVEDARRRQEEQVHVARGLRWRADMAKNQAVREQFAQALCEEAPRRQGAQPSVRTLPHNPDVPESPVPTLSGSVPHGAPVWSSTDAALWAQARPASWARPIWSILALVITVVWAGMAEPAPSCSDAAPCGPDWGSMVQGGLAAGLLYWFARLPELTLIAAPVVAAMVEWGKVPGADRMSHVADFAVIAALGFGWAAAVERLTARSRQRRLAERAAGVRHRLPQPAGPLVRGTFPLAAGLVLCAVAAGAILAGLNGIRADERHADRAAHITATVTHRGEETVRVRTADQRRITVDAFYPEDYRVGSTVTVLEDGSWRRLAAEPYDAFGWQLLALAAALPGLSFLTAGALARHRAAALRRAPVPALRVLDRMDHEGRTWIYAADDTVGRTPLFSCLWTATLADDDKLMGRVEDDDGVEEGARVDTRLHEAVLLGAPYEGGELVLVTTDRAGDPVVLRTASPVRLPRTGKKPLLKSPTSTGPDTSDLQRRDRIDRIAATLTPAGRPRRWGPGAAARTAGAALTAAVTTGAFFTAHLLATDGFDWHLLLPLLTLPVWIHLTALLLNWRATADSTGLWLTGAWTVRHIPWDRLRAARYTDQGSIEIHRTDGTTWHLAGLGEPRLERRLRLRPAYVRMAEEISALGTRPELRPIEASARRDHGLPLGPFLLLLVGLAVTVALIT
ncbi:hypothetical protein [Streptomyces sp. NPDC007070]|uniref:hypothetical protein n=1 Tax=Streptomyces sp. NPDC007070 TaxID=3154312 RepID=UPI0033E28165